MKTIHINLLLILSALAWLTGCVPQGEPPTREDATPPPGYNPVFIKKTAPYGSLPPSAPPPVAQISRIETHDLRKVRVYVHIVDSNGTYLTGASAAKYRKIWCGVTEDVDGQQTEIKNYKLTEATESDHEPNAIAIVMDHSGSMGETRAMTVQNAVAEIIGAKKDEDAFALVKYDDKTVVEAPLTTSRPELMTKFQRNGLTGFGGGTAINDGIATGINQVAAAGGYKHKAVVVFTDGLDNSSSIKKDSLFAMAQRNNVLLCTVAFGNNVNQNLLQEYASGTGGTYQHIYGTKEFNMVFDDIYKRLRNYYLIEYTPVDYGVHTIRIKLCAGKDSAVATAEYDNTPDIGSVALLSAFFDYNKAELKPESKRGLENVVALMKAFPRMTIEVRGHTDNQNMTKDVNFNQRLSQKRADNVRAELIKMGVQGDRITSTGYGDKQPLADNATESGRAQNRRTEFLILSR